MSAVAANAATSEHTGQQIRIPLRPFCLRPLIVVLVVAAHAGALASFNRLIAEKVTAVSDIEVEIVPEGETVTETSSVPTPDAAPVVTPDQAVLASPDPEPLDAPDVKPAMQETKQTAAPPEIMAPPPKIEVDEAPPISIEQPIVQTAEKPDAAATKPEQTTKEIEVQEASSRAALQAEMRAEAEKHAPQQAALMQLGAPAIRAGVSDGSGDAPRMSQSAYSALVSAEINRRKFYPASAQGTGTGGNVGVVFTIGPTGSVVSHTITRSSGNTAIDATVHAMMSATHAPPPPGGHFLGRIVIRFNLSR